MIKKMEIKETSIESFYELARSGILSELLLKHLMVFYIINKPCTARQAHEVYCRYFNAEPNLNQFRSKVKMLVDRKSLVELSETCYDEKTGRRVTLYAVTGTCDKPVKVKAEKIDVKEDILKKLSELYEFIRGNIFAEQKYKEIYQLVNLKL